MAEYEWVVEVMDGDDIEETESYGDDIAAALREAAETGGQVVLVRDAWKGPTLDRTWAYVTDGKLPERFSDSDDLMMERPGTGVKVPKIFHAALLGA